MKKLLWIALALSLLAVLMMPLISYAANSATQSASIKNITAISIKAQDYQTDISNITFPSGSPGDTIANPRNNINNSTSPQAFGGSGDAKPVATLVNTDASHQYFVFYNISSWTNSVVSSEYYCINSPGASCTNDLVNSAVTFGSNTNTGVTIAPSVDTTGSKKDLYLKVILSNTGGISGISTISIISEPY